MLKQQIIISQEKAEKCLSFAVNFIANEKSGLDFGNKKLPRNTIDKIADCAEGKIGELAFAEFIKINLGFEIEVDFDIVHGRHETDKGQDIDKISYKGNVVKPTFKVDIKTSRSGSIWLLVEDHKYGSEWADSYAFVTTDLNRNIEKDLSGLHKEVICTIHGFSYAADFMDNNGNEFFYFKGNNKKLIKHNIVNEIINIASKENTKKFNRNELITAYKYLVKNKKLSNNDIFINFILKCESQKGLPIMMLRNTRKDYDALFKILFNKLKAG